MPFMRSLKLWMAVLASGLLCVPSLALPNPLDTKSIQQRDIYKLIDPDTEVRKYQIAAGFYEAVSLAQGAIDTQRQDIFEKYFRPGDRAIVNQVFANIVASKPDLGAAQFADINVVFRDPHHLCESNSRGAIHYEPGPPITITLCPSFWVYYGGNLASRPCRGLGNSVSLLMETVSSLILRQFLYPPFVSAPAPGGKIQNWQIQNAGKLIANQVATYIATNAPQIATQSADNYEWFATEVWWSKRCNKNYLNPRNEIEAARGKCSGTSCTSPEGGPYQELR